MFMQRLWEALKKEKSYLLLSCLLFLCSCLYGILFWEQVQESLKAAGIFDQLGKITQQIEKTPPFVSVFSMIFLNNLMVSLLTIISGLAFGIYPIFILMNNGMLMGAVIIGSANGASVHPIILFLTTILPHGLFELPAILVSAALGIHLGISVIQSLFFLLTRRYQQVVANWKVMGRRLLVIVVGIVGCLLIAAIIEAALILVIKSLH